jgi:hypothetical protein
MSYGAQAKVGFARQTNPGSYVIATSAPTSYHAMGFVSHDIGLEKEELISQNLIGRFEQGATYSGAGKVAGTIEFEATPRNLLTALGLSVNHVAATVDSGAIRTWTMLPNTADYDSSYVKAPWSMYSQFADAQSADLFFDMQFGQLDLVLSQGQFTRGRIQCVGGNRVSTGVGSANVVPDASDAGRLFPWNVASISYGGTALQTASDVTVSLNENIDGLYTINGSLLPFKYTRTGFREVTVNGTFYMTDRSMLNNFVNETQGRLLITLISTVAAIQSGYYNTLTIDVPQLKVTAFKPAVSGPGEVSVPFTGRGVIDPSSNYALQFTLVNTRQVNL